MSYLVDSDWVVDFLLGRPAAVTLLAVHLESGLAFSIVTYAEVYPGIYFGHDPSGAETVFRRFLEQVRVVGISRAIARRSARLRGELQKQGMPIPQPDLFIAATAIHHERTLLTRNLRHFGRIPNLTLAE